MGLRTRLLIAALYGLGLSSCGVIFGGSRFKGTIIVKNHPNAQVYVQGNKIGEGIAVGLFSRKLPFIVEIRQDGCDTEKFVFNNTFRTGNFLLTTLTFVGIFVDSGTGACYKPDHISNPAIKRLSDKDYVFSIDYSQCAPESNSDFN